MGLLEDAERSLLETAAVFVDGWTAEAAAQVAGLDEDEALERFEALARHSLIYLDPADDGPRLRMLETIRAFVAERLAARPDAAEIRRRHAGYYRALAEQADRPLRGAGQREWCRAPGGRGRQSGRRRALVPRQRHRTAAAPVPGPLALLVPAGPSGRGPLLGRPAAAHRRLLRPPGPGRAGVDGGGDRPRGGRRPDGADGPRAPGAAARRDRGPVPPRRVPAGHGVDRRGSSATSTAPCRGRRSPWSSSVPRTSRSGPRSPPTPPASWR